ncbi:MAG: hypothetical protein B7Y39_17080 [Bdellovibrio sp. 28-41-41]|nr:MAG: hypothetical protein B7Y39_17080 [Bdellovibrio sp. 28-41-41]
MNSIIIRILLVTIAAPVLAAGKPACGIDQIDDEVVTYISMSAKCSQDPGLNRTDFNGGGIYGDYEGPDAKKRGDGYSLSKEVMNSHKDGKICYYTGCRKLAVSDAGTKPQSNWQLCLDFPGGTSVPHKKNLKCPIAIKVQSRFRELVLDSKSSNKCCYNSDAPIPP